jgi:hypothetical protein
MAWRKNHAEAQEVFGNRWRCGTVDRFWTTAYTHEVRLLLSKPLQKRYYILQIGEGMDILPLDR